MISINWSNIRTLNGSQATGFEELCAQLARSFTPDNAQFIRKGTPDAGVECYAAFEDGSEWGWQAKYFLNTLENSQWQQLDKSVKTALGKHPNLVKYHICIPLDRPDARINGQQSAMKKWNNHVTKWSTWAAKKNMNVEFIWWGNSELIHLLSHEEHSGRIRFFFDNQVLSREWFSKRQEEAISAAGPRYKAELNVDLPILEVFEAFLRTKQFMDKVKTHVPLIGDKKRSLEYSLLDIKEDEILNAISELLNRSDEIVAGISALRTDFIEELPFKIIIDQIEDLEEDGDRIIYSLNDISTRNKKESAAASSHYHTPDKYIDCATRLQSFSLQIFRTREALDEWDYYSNNQLMLLTGSAGTGKTHLLCDLAQQRTAKGKPTILLMGQCFTGTGEPWTQALEQLDYRNGTVEEFIGALEAAAQAANCKALVIVDALNEGQGRTIWPTHLAAFLAHLERSTWINVVLAVRSPYEEVIFTESIRGRAIRLKHLGFEGCEYDAVKSFFAYYKLELPSTPVFSPEFRNPLFLKLLCKGLHDSGEHRLPRGHLGISKIFDLYLSEINKRLAKILGYTPQKNLVQTALNSFAQALANGNVHWLSLINVLSIVDNHLPGRKDEESLYRALITEGLLVEEITPDRNGNYEDVVIIGYERLADHLIASHLLDAHLNNDTPESAFASTGSLAFLYDKDCYISSGLIEALSIQIPERTGKELLDIAPSVKDLWCTRTAYQNSLIWRSPEAFTPNAINILNDLIVYQNEFDESLDVVLTLATIPNHPLNAYFLDKKLRNDSMADRDSWWSTFLHRTWGNKSTVDRIVDWAFSLDKNIDIDSEAVLLCSITLTWVLATSNRFLRDRATKALVNLLTGRTDIALSLLERFHDVDDLYVQERLYAVVYGLAMRSSDCQEVGRMAQKVYDNIFANGSPVPHILLRDYARGTVERALYLGAQISIKEHLIRPPYHSDWPHIPSEDDIQPLLAHSDNKDDAAKNRIATSIMHDDFAHYVIHADRGRSEWLSVPINEPRWQPPKIRREKLVNELTDEQKDAWKQFESACDSLKGFRQRKEMAIVLKTVSDKKMEEVDWDVDDVIDEDESSIIEAERERKASLIILKSLLSPQQVQELEEILCSEEIQTYDNAPRFDHRIIQHYVLWRVFDLGWTTEWFGVFDQFEVSREGISADKAERLGKKYQWIAYHEIMALVADNYQYRDGYGNDVEHDYEGPWQLSLRNIDPSCTLRTTPGGNAWGAHTCSWWAPEIYKNWEDNLEAKCWVARQDDLPPLENLIRVQAPGNGDHWLNLCGFLEWESPVPPESERTDVERRQIWYLFNAYLINKSDLGLFMDWAKQNDFMGRWMPEPQEEYRMFFGEHGWSPASRYVDDSRWFTAPNDCPVKFRLTAFEYLKETSTFDCSIDDRYTLRMPDKLLLRDLGLRWSGRAADFGDSKGEIVVMDPTAYDAGPQSLLIKEAFLRDYLERDGLALVWAVIGEKEAFGPGMTPQFLGRLSITGAYTLAEKGVAGFIKFPKESP